MDYQAQLNKQLRFLQRSCDAFDAGDKDEAIRIAQAIRVLIHDTGNSTSLLKHLGATTINLVSNSMDIPDHVAFYSSLNVTQVIDGEMSQVPKLEIDNGTESIPVSKWWNQIVYKWGADRDQRYTRRDIILSAANKDGGAHVGKKFPKAYSRLVEGEIMSIKRKWGRGPAEPVKDWHLIVIRSMAFELLNSPELIALANTGYSAPA